MSANETGRGNRQRSHIIHANKDTHRECSCGHMIICACGGDDIKVKCAKRSTSGNVLWDPIEQMSTIHSYDWMTVCRIPTATPNATDTYRFTRMAKTNSNSNSIRMYRLSSGVLSSAKLFDRECGNEFELRSTFNESMVYVSCAGLYDFTRAYTWDGIRNERQIGERNIH